MLDILIVLSAILTVLQMTYRGVRYLVVRYEYRRHIFHGRQSHVIREF